VKPARTRRWFLAVFSVCAGAGLAACSPRPSIEGVPPEPPAAVRRGDEAFQYQDYDRAIDAYGSYLGRVRTGPYTAIAEYKSALAAYRLKRYDQTLFILDDLDSRYPEGKWMQADALRGDAERALGRNMLAIRAWADAWDLAGPEDQEKLAQRFRTVARTLDAAQLAEARSLVDNEDVRELLYPQGAAIPTIGEPLHEYEEDEELGVAPYAAAPRPQATEPPPRRAAAPPPLPPASPPMAAEFDDDDTGTWTPPDLEDLPTEPPSAAAAPPAPNPSPAARLEPPVPAPTPVVEARYVPPVAAPPPPPAPPADPAAVPPAEPVTAPPAEPVVVAALPASPADATIPSSDARVGVLLPVTGVHGAAGTAAWHAIQLAFANTRWRLMLIDTGKSGEREGLDELWADPKVVAVIGPFETAGAQGAAAAVDGLPPIVLPDEPGVGPVRLPLTAGPVDLLGPLLRYATGSVQIRRFAILYPDTADGRAARDAVQTAVENLGRSVVGTIGYPAGTASLASQEQQLIDWREQDDLQAVFLADGATMARPLAAFLQREMPDVTLLGVSHWEILADGGASTDGVLFADTFYADSARPETRDFVAAYRAAYGAQPESLAAQAYDVATLARRALTLGVDSRASMRERVREVGVVNGATGLVEVTPDGVTRPGVVLQVYDGKVREVGRSG